MEQRMTGTFYGVSVGPGDPELLTLQAVRLLRQCPVLAAPQTASGQMLALDIARRALGSELDGKTILPLQFAMSRDAAVLRASHETAASAVRPFLDAGQDVAMLNLGDVSIYVTFGYLQEILQGAGLCHRDGSGCAQLLRGSSPAEPAPYRRHGRSADHRPRQLDRQGIGRPRHESPDENRASAARPAGHPGRPRCVEPQRPRVQLRPAG